MSTEYRFVVELEKTVSPDVYDPETTETAEYRSGWYSSTIEADEDSVTQEALRNHPGFAVIGWHHEWRNIEDGKPNDEGPAWNKA